MIYETDCICKEFKLFKNFPSKSYVLCHSEFVDMHIEKTLKFVNAHLTHISSFYPTAAHKKVCEREGEKIVSDSKRPSRVIHYSGSP